MLSKLLLMSVFISSAHADLRLQAVGLETCTYEVAKSYLENFRAAGGMMQTKPEMRLVLRTVVATCIDRRHLNSGLTEHQVSGILTAGYLRAVEDVYH